MWHDRRDRRTSTGRARQGQAWSASFRTPCIPLPPPPVPTSGCWRCPWGVIVWRLPSGACEDVCSGHPSNCEQGLALSGTVGVLSSGFHPACSLLRQIVKELVHRAACMVWFSVSGFGVRVGPAAVSVPYVPVGQTRHAPAASLRQVTTHTMSLSLPLSKKCFLEHMTNHCAYDVYSC